MGRMYVQIFFLLLHSSIYKKPILFEDYHMSLSSPSKLQGKGRMADPRRSMLVCASSSPHKEISDNIGCEESDPQANGAGLSTNVHYYPCKVSTNNVQ